MTTPDRLAERLDEKAMVAVAVDMDKRWFTNRMADARAAIAVYLKALATPVPGTVSNAMVERAWDRLFPGNLTVISITKADLTTALEAAVQSPPIVGVRAGTEYGRKLIAEAIQAHFGEQPDIEEERPTDDDTTLFDVWEAFDALSLAPVEAVATEPVAHDNPYEGMLNRIIEAFDKDETAQQFLRDDGDGGFPAGIYRMAREIDRLRAPTGDSGALREALDGLNLLLGQAIHHLRNHDIYTHKTYADLANELQVWAKEHRAALSKGEPGK